jgi:hypothetical protein
MVTPDIELTDSESVLLAQIEFDWERQTPESYAHNSEVAAALSRSLLDRGATLVFCCLRQSRSLRRLRIRFISLRSFGTLIFAGPHRAFGR